MKEQKLFEEIEQEDILYKGKIEHPFDPKKIEITTKQMILEAIFKRLRNKEIDLKTFFQRKENLWNKTQQSRLIESILIRLPLPAFYFDGTDDGRWLVVDGLQRLCTFQNYVIEINFKLQNLEYLTQFNEYTFDKLPRYLQRRIEEHEITVYIINPGTPKEVKFNLFKRVNTGGLILTAQEIRHALNQGIPTKFIDSLAESNEFKRYEVNPKRMADRDFVTRFVAFYLHTFEQYKPDLDDFLNKSMGELEIISENNRIKLKSDFLNAMNRAWQLFETYAFRKQYKINDIMKPLNKALFEVWSVTLSKLHENKFQVLLQNKNKLNEKFIELLNNDKDFEKSISSGTGDPKNVRKRFNTIKNLINSII